MEIGLAEAAWVAVGVYIITQALDWVVMVPDRLRINRVMTQRTELEIAALTAEKVSHAQAVEVFKEHRKQMALQHAQLDNLETDNARLRQRLSDLEHRVAGKGGD